MVRGEAYKIPPTIIDASFLPDILEIILAKGLGVKSGLAFSEAKVVEESK